MSEAGTICPRCGLLRGNVVTVSHPRRGIVFQGCSDCLIGELDTLANFRGPQCATCGTAKVPLTFDTGAQRLECPVHVHGKALLGRVFQSLCGSEEEGAQEIVAEIKKVLGVRV